MRTIVIASIAFALIGSNLGQAQSNTPADGSQPATSNIAGQEYPRVFEMEDTGETLRIIKEFTGESL